MALEKLADGTGGESAWLTCDLATPFEKNEQGNRSDGDAPRGFTEQFRIRLGDEPAIGSLRGDLRDFGRDDFTRFAPRCPKINQHRQARPTREGVKLFIVLHLDRFGGNAKLPSTFRAVRNAVQPLVGQSIILPAVRAAYDESTIVGLGGAHQISYSTELGAFERGTASGEERCRNDRHGFRKRSAADAKRKSGNYTLSPTFFPQHR